MHRKVTAGYRLLSVIGATILGAVLIAACGGGDEQSSAATDSSAEVAAEDVPYSGPEEGLASKYPEPKSGGGFTIGWLNPAGSAETVATEQRAFQLEIERLGGKSIALDDRIDVDRQVSNFKQLLAQGVDAIGYFPIDPAATDPVLEEAQRQGVPVLAINKTQTPDEPAGQVATQIYQGSDHQAYSQVRYVAEQHPGGTIASIGIAAPVPAINYWEDRVGFWAEKFGLQYLGNEDDPTGDVAGGQQAASALLTKNADLDAVVAYNGPTACATGTAARASGRDDLTVVSLLGQAEGLECVQNGRADADFQLDAIGMGTQAAKALWTLAGDSSAELPPIVMRTIDSEPITPDNVDEFQTWADTLDEMEAGQ